MRIMDISEDEREKETESIFKELIAMNFTKLEKEVDIQAQEANRIP